MVNDIFVSSLICMISVGRPCPPVRRLLLGATAPRVVQIVMVKFVLGFARNALDLNAR